MGKLPSSFCYLLGRSLGLAKLLAVIGEAGLAQPVGQPEGSALGASGDAGRLQLPYRATALIPALLGYF